VNLYHQNPLHAPTRQAGFTLVEMMTVVIVLAIVAALAVPMMSNTASDKLKGAASMLIADLAFAQVESIAHGDDPRLLVFDNPNDTYHIAATSDTATPITNPITRQPYLIDYDTSASGSLIGVTITSYSLDGDDQLAFGIYGGLDQATPATITLACDTMTITVTTDPNTGEASMGAIN
jgi:type IV pilus assembly protein PilA